MKLYIINYCYTKHVCPELDLIMSGSKPIFFFLRISDTDKTTVETFKGDPGTFDECYVCYDDFFIRGFKPKSDFYIVDSGTNKSYTGFFILIPTYSGYFEKRYYDGKPLFTHDNLDPSRLLDSLSDDDSLDSVKLKIILQYRDEEN